MNVVRKPSLNIDQDNVNNSNFQEKDPMCLTHEDIEKTINIFLSAVENLRARGYKLNVDIVGIESNLISKKFDWLTIHGYLDKGRPSDKHKYYDLLKSIEREKKNGPAREER